MLPTQKNKDIVEQIKKLSSRIDTLHQTKAKLFEFLLKVSMLYKSHTKSVQNTVQNFEDMIIKKSFYSIRKCQRMKRFLAVYKRILVFVENVSKVHEIQLKKININNEKKQDKVKKKSEAFTKSVLQYSSNEESYNKRFSGYSYECKKLDEMMQKYKQLQNPLLFYNPSSSTNYLKSLEKTYHECENKQTQLATGLQLLDEKRKILTQNLKEIQEQYVNLLYYHMDNVCSAARVLTDKNQEEYNIVVTTVKIDKTDGDVFKEEIRAFDDKYGKMCEIGAVDRQLLNDLKELFGTQMSGTGFQNQDMKITTDDRLFLDRCQSLTRKKTQSTEEFMFLQKMMIEEIQNQITHCQKLSKQFQSIQKSCFKSNGAQDFQKKLHKYFGEGILNVGELCFIISEVPKIRLQKIGKFLSSIFEKLQKCHSRKEQQLKKFKKRVKQLFTEYNNFAKGVQNNLASINQLKNYIEKTFILFRNCFGEFCKNQNEIDSEFQDVVKKVTIFVERQSAHMNLNYTISRPKEKFLYELFMNLDIDKQIVEIVKEDTRYQVLFNDSLKPDLFDKFKSLVEKKNFEQTKKILQKKEYQSRGLIGEKKIGCCGMPSKTRKYTKLTEHQVSLVCEDETQRYGKLEILNKGINFEEKKKNPFSQKVQILIPIKEILSFSSKTFNDGRQGVQILTCMGPVYFYSEENNKLQESLQENIGKKMNYKQQNDSRRDRSSDTSSFFKQNNTSTEYKVSFQKSGSELDIKDKVKRPNNDSLVLKKLIQELKKTKFLSDFFMTQLQHSTQNVNTVRIDYKFKDDLNKFLLKQKRGVKTNGGTDNSVFVNFTWKISFPEMPMLKSFTHGEEVKITLIPNLAKIVIIEKNRGDSYLYVRKTFYNQIDKMNKKLSDTVATITEREASVFVDQERPDTQESTLNLDLQNLGLNKEEVQNKGLYRIPSGSIANQSEKTHSKLNIHSDL